MSEVAILKTVDEVPCPHCRVPVAIKWETGAETVVRCHLPCGELFAIRFVGHRVFTAKIGWNQAQDYWRPDTPIAEFKAATAPSPTADTGIGAVVASATSTLSALDAQTGERGQG